LGTNRALALRCSALSAPVASEPCSSRATM
jgi:hypothetical protein